jgi:hypothetical protein
MIAAAGSAWTFGDIAPGETAMWIVGWAPILEDATVCFGAAVG